MYARQSGLALSLVKHYQSSEDNLNLLWRLTETNQRSRLMEATAPFLFIAFFLTVGAFILGGVLVWNLKDLFDAWYDNAGYAKHVLHPEMFDENGQMYRDDLLRVTFMNDDDEYDDED